VIPAKVVANPTIGDRPDAAGFILLPVSFFASCGDATSRHHQDPGQIHRHRKRPPRSLPAPLASTSKLNNIFLPAADFDAPAAGEGAQIEARLVSSS